MRMRLTQLLPAVALAAAMLLPVRAETVGATIDLTLDVGDLAVTNGAVTLYQVALPGQEGYELTEAFGGGMVKWEDATASSLAQWLAQNAQEGGITRLLDADGRAEFTRLPDGLYLIMQTERMDGFYPFQPFLVTVPRDGERVISLRPAIFPIVTQPPATGQDAQPLLGLAGMALSGLALWTLLRKRAFFGI